LAGEKQLAPGQRIGGVAGWLLKRFIERLRGGQRAQPRLTLVERIALAPRQSLALVEAEGRRILVATSAEGGPAFYALNEGARTVARRETQRRSRVSW
jgi:flagellar biogenesis protein FliO